MRLRADADATASSKRAGRTRMRTRRKRSGEQSAQAEVGAGYGTSIRPLQQRMCASSVRQTSDACVTGGGRQCAEPKGGRAPHFFVRRFPF